MASVLASRSTHGRQPHTSQHRCSRSINALEYWVMVNPCVLEYNMHIALNQLKFFREYI
jgi:hypothetical protein